MAVCKAAGLTPPLILQGVHFVVTPGSKGSPGALMTTHVVQKSRKDACMFRSPNKSSVGVSDTFVLSPD
jgi:hypothetical protein